MADIPPWLDIHPDYLSKALMGGMEFGQQRKEAADRQSNAKTQLEQQAQELQLKGREFQESQKEFGQNLLLEKTRQDSENEMMKQKIAEAQRTVQAKRGYMDDTANGMDSTEAYMKWGPQMGETSGLGTIAAEKIRSQTIPIPTLDADGNQNGFTVNGVWHQIKPDKATIPGNLTETDKATQSVLERRIDSIDKEIDKLDPKLDADRIKTLTKQRDEYESKIDKILPSLGGKDSTPTTSDPQTGTNDLVPVINPSGKRVRINKSQLDDALKQRYQQP